MGQKVNPHGLRVGVIKDWDSRWYARNEKVGDLIVEDYKIRKYLKKTLYSAGVPTIEIERDSAKIRIYIHCSRPGVVIGKGGTEIEKLRLTMEKMLGKNAFADLLGGMVVKPSGKPTLVPRSDKREEMTTVTNAFMEENCNE